MGHGNHSGFTSIKVKNKRKILRIIKHIKEKAFYIKKCVWICFLWSEG